MAKRIKNEVRFTEISNLLDDFSNEILPLNGLTSIQQKDALVMQLVDSIRRIEFLNLTSTRAKSIKLYTPYSGSFEPFGGAGALYKLGKIDDAYWLVYLATHFGKHKIDGWNLTEDFYGRFGQGGVWDWAAASQTTHAISDWLEIIYPHVTTSGRSRRFGNHRKFETLKPGSKGTGHATASYVEWIMQFGSHEVLITTAQKSVGQNPQAVYAFLFKELDKVAKLGRLGKFDFLCNLSNLLIAPIFPDRAYIEGSTGPIDGARLLFANSMSAIQLDKVCTELAKYIDASPQVIEDALCNWQKSPNEYKYFRG